MEQLVIAAHGCAASGRRNAGVTVIVPTRNERDNIRPVLDRLGELADVSALSAVVEPAR